MRKKMYTFTCGPFRATVYPICEPEETDAAPYAIDLYYDCDERLHSRFVCTGEEARQLQAAAAAAQELVTMYLLRGSGFPEWCRDKKLDPHAPDLNLDPPLQPVTS